MKKTTTKKYFLTLNRYVPKVKQVFTTKSQAVKQKNKLLGKGLNPRIREQKGFYDVNGKFYRSW